MRLKPLDLIVTMLIVAMNVGWVLLPGRSPVIGIILALPLVFLLPGYTLTEVLFYERSPDISDRLLRKPKLRIERPFNASDHFILSLGLSMAIDILTGFILNMLPSGLQAQSWAVFLGFVTTVFSLLAAYLRRGARLNANKASSPRFRITIYECVLLGLAITVAILSVLYSGTSAAQQQHPGFTQFWMLPSKQTDKSCAVLLGVHSFESNSVTYRIVVTMNGTSIHTWPSVVLAPQQEWDQLVSLSSGTASNLHVEGQLYQSNKPATVYRKVNVTLHSLGNSKDGKALQCGTA